jgi:hypothetical protein
VHEEPVVLTDIPLSSQMPLVVLPPSEFRFILQFQYGGKRNNLPRQVSNESPQAVHFSQELLQVFLACRCLNSLDFFYPLGINLYAYIMNYEA